MNDQVFLESCLRVLLPECTAELGQWCFKCSRGWKWPWICLECLPSITITDKLLFSLSILLYNLVGQRSLSKVDVESELRFTFTADKPHLVLYKFCFWGIVNWEPAGAVVDASLPWHGEGIQSLSLWVWCLSTQFLKPSSFTPNVLSVFSRVLRVSKAEKIFLAGRDDFIFPGTTGYYSRPLGDGKLPEWTGKKQTQSENTSLYAFQDFSPCQSTLVGPVLCCPVPSCLSLCMYTDLFNRQQLFDKHLFMGIVFSFSRIN